jgi:hypothetical protein
MLGVLTFGEYGKNIRAMSDDLNRIWKINTLTGIYNIEKNTFKNHEKHDLVFHSLPFDIIQDETERKEYIQKNMGGFKSFLWSTFIDEEFDSK